jgi:hypothetical protein
MLNEQDAEFPVGSNAVQVTTSVPTGKAVLLDGIEHVTVAEPLLSSARAGLQFTTPWSSLREVEAMTLAGQVINGGMMSPTNTSKVHEARLPDVSVTVQVTVLVP